MGDNNSIPIPEYPPIRVHCDCCGAELEGDRDIFEERPDRWICEDCFLEYCKDNIDIYQMAKWLHVPRQRASYLYE